MKPNNEEEAKGADDDFVTMDYGGGLVIKIDPAAHWQRLIEETPEDQNDSIVSGHHWMIVLFDINLPQDQKNRFWEDYQQPEAEKNRKKALKGLAWVNYEAERDLLNHTLWEHEQREKAIAEKNEEACKLAWDGMALTGIKFADLVHALDYKAFERMAKILKEGKTPVSDAPKGGEHSDAGQMLRHFIRLHLETRGLPTKKELREACGLTDDPKRASSLMKELGLSGLPQAS